MIKILLIGNGAREHALAEALSKSPQKPKLFSYIKSNNPGITGLSDAVELGNYEDLEKIKAFAVANAADFCIIGPEAPLAVGAVDALQKINIPSVGPTKELARLETSKSFTRLLMHQYSIEGSPNFKVFESPDGIKEFVKDLNYFVVKPDGLTGGKGVKVQGDHFKTAAEGIKYAIEVLKDHPAVVIEEKLDGEEFSLQSFTDGRHVSDCIPVQDHKRAFDNDLGPNTGGMGSYSDSNHLLPFLTKKDVEDAHKITEKVAKAIKKETNEDYKGVMYGGFIAVKDGVKLIEYNARLGDPEAMNALSILKTDFVDLCYGITEGTLNRKKLEFENKATVCKYVVPEGYPGNPVKNEKISLREVPKNAKTYYASVDKKPDGLHMSTSRAVAFVGIGYNLEEAEVIAEDACSSVIGKVFHRKDIGTKELIGKRVRHMQMLRGKR